MSSAPRAAIVAVAVAEVLRKSRRVTEEGEVFVIG
jgi:hypothetical protein